MNVYPIIRKALASLNLPMYPETYDGDAQEYITYNYTDERAEVSGDDDDIYDVTSVQVHYWTRGDPHTIKSTIRRLLRSAGFSITSTQQLYDESGYRHVIVEAELAGIINDE